MAREGVIISMDRKVGVSRSWILLHCNGEEKILDVDKYAIMHMFQIHARDYRILDPALSYPSTILGRERAIVLNLEHIKAVITAEEVLLHNPLDETIIPIVEELRRRLPLVNTKEKRDRREHLSGQDDLDVGEDGMSLLLLPLLCLHLVVMKRSHWFASTVVIFFFIFDIRTLFLSFDGVESSDVESPFEFRALEVALEAICSSFDACTKEQEHAAYPALYELTSKISSRNLDRVRKLKTSMTRLTARVQKVRDELEQLLDDDDDMASLYLSRKSVGLSSSVCGSVVPIWLPTSLTIGSKISRATYRASPATIQGNENDVEELEMLLEAYFMQIDGTLNKLTTLREYINDTEDYINIQLDNHRNQLIQLELFLTSATVCLSIYSLVAGIFGMNIPYTWNKHHGYIFKWVVVLSGVLCAFLFVLIVSYARHKGLLGS